MVAPDVVGHIDPVCLVEPKTNGKPGNRRAGLVGGADRDPAHRAASDAVADLEAEGVGLVTCFATHDGILAVARAAWRR
jgi:hypothetical protein